MTIRCCNGGRWPNPNRSGGPCGVIGDVGERAIEQGAEGDRIDGIAERVDGIAEPAVRRHVPRLIVEVDELPRTRSGKLVELAVGDVVNGREVRHIEAVADLEALWAVRDAVGAGSNSNR